ncbi:LysR family transcriptional regulator [Frankia sp. QA3]|uniref:LysR family transcriptional regulator n=1 Tax=Frankia sp. QA3 TaxID=710111 RepID=UPI000269BF83|nr:LysR family transcriptional regulator [Frankia sp. QA3]EIV92868.1 transcriptional regulator [Frankia sp. QA3]
MKEVRYSLRQLRYFVAVVDAGTISSAAEALRVSPAGVSLAVAGLERAMAAQLLVRHRGRGVSLTAAGADLLAEARALLEAAGELQERAHDLGQALAGRLVVGCYTPLGPFLLPRLLRGFGAEYPEIVLDFVEGSASDLHDQLVARGCELALLYDLDVLAGTATETVSVQRPHVILPAGHRLAGAQVVDIRDLAAEPMVALDVPPSMHHTQGVFDAVGVVPRIVHRSTSFELVRSLVGRGLGYSLLIQQPETDRTYDGRRVVTRPILGDPGELAIVLARPAGLRPTRRALAFARFCRDVLGERRP